LPPGLVLAEPRRSPNPAVPLPPGLVLAEPRRSPNPAVP